MLNIIDSAIPQNILNACIQEAEYSTNYSVLHGAGDGSYGFKYNWLLQDSNQPNTFTNQQFKVLWEEVKQHVPANTRLYRAYVNAHTYGVEDAIHVDDAELKKGFTVIVYLCNGWYPEWFGQTVFFKSLDKQNNDIINSVLPQYNRVIIFDKDIPHCVSPLSRKFAGVRLTCMFKLELLDDTA
jgi:SM-20-related protein